MFGELAAEERTQGHATFDLAWLGMNGWGLPGEPLNLDMFAMPDGVGGFGDLSSGFDAGATDVQAIQFGGFSTGAWDGSIGGFSGGGDSGGGGSRRACSPRPVTRNSWCCQRLW